MGVYSSKVKCNVLRHMRSQHQNQHGRGYGMEHDSSEYGHGDTDEESVDDTEENTGDEMDEDDGGEYGHGDTDEESVDDSEQSEDNEINTRGPTSVTYGAPYYEFRIGAGIGGLLRARYRMGIGGLIKGC